MPSVLKGIEDNITLTYKKVDGNSGDTDPVTGEAIKQKTDATMVVSFAPSKNDALIYRDGAEVLSIPGTVTCLDPVTFPDDLREGDELDMTFKGVAGKLTIDHIIKDTISFIENITGQVARATWQPSN